MEKCEMYGGCWNPSGSPSSEVDTAPEQWRSQCLVARIQRDEALKLHAYANEQRKAADNARMNAEETVARLRARVDELLKHGKDACEYTDGWDDALLKVRDELSPENDLPQLVSLFEL